MLKLALQKAKKEDEKKVSINFQVSSSLKEKFDNLCRENDVSLTAILNSLMETSIEEANEAKYSAIRNDIKSIERIDKDLSADIVVERKDFLLSVKQRFDEYIKENGKFLPTSNAYNPNEYIDISIYPLMIDSYIHFAEKEKK